LASTQIAVSFEDGLAKVAYGTLTHGDLVVTRTLTLKDEEFDDFLTREKTPDFIVVNNFKNFYQDVLLLPPTGEKYLKTLVESGIRKNAPELKNFTFFYAVLRERLHEGKMVKETFVFAVDNSELNLLIERFTRYGKNVSRLYSDVFTLSQLIQSSGESDDKTVLCILDSSSTKSLFLIREGKLFFIRVVQSHQAGLDEYDISNINMTINYTRQTLRDNPSKAVLISPSKREHEVVEGLTIPSAFIEYPPNIVAAEEVKQEFVLPIAAILTAKKFRRESLLPKTYRGFLVQKTILLLCIGVFLLSSVLGLGYMMLRFYEVYSIKKSIAPLKDTLIGRQGVYNEFVDSNRELQKFTPLLNYLNTENATPDIQKALIALQSLQVENIRIKDIEVKNDRQELIVQIKGIVVARTYTELQLNFQKLLSNIKKTDGMEISSQKVDLIGKDFSIEVKWKM
jgi:hypothetical protein